MKKLLFLIIALFAINSVNAQNLISINNSLKSSVDEIKIGDDFKEAKRLRYLFVNEQVQTKNQVKDTLLLDLFNNKRYKACVDKVSINVNGTLSIRAKMVGFNFAYCFIITSNKKTDINIEIPEKNEYYSSSYDKKSEKYFLMEIDKSKQDYLESVPCVIPPADNSITHDFFKNEKMIQEMTTKSLNEVEDAVDTITVLVVYTQAAKAYTDEYNHNMENIISSAIDKGNLVLENSETFLFLKLVHSEQVDYEELYTTQDLDNLRINGDGLMDNVHVLRDEYAADLVVLFEGEDFIAAGVSYMFKDEYDSPDFGFSINNIKNVRFGHTTMHEIGHNLGCGHSYLQSFDLGPGIYSYSSGYRWQAANDNYYTTVMSYSSGFYYPDGNQSIGVGYFSNPNVQYGDVALADNARTIRETKLTIAAFRTTPITGITEFKNVEIFTLYPNPTSGLLNIQPKTISVKNSQKITINLIDYLGKKQELEIINKNSDIIQVNVGNQNTGIYFLQIMIDNELTKTLKVIIKD